MSKSSYNAHFIHLRDDNGNPYGTLAYKVDPEGTDQRITLSYAMCSARDQFSYKIGRSIASFRLNDPSAWPMRTSFTVRPTLDRANLRTLVLAQARTWGLTRRPGGYK